MKDLLFRYNLFRYNQHRKHKNYVCLAPFSSLFLDYKGNVFACFANKHILLGNYFKDSLLEIWNGEQVKKLQTNIINRKLQYGCQVCKDKITRGQFTQVYARHYDGFVINESNMPSALELQLTNRCNLECLMCVVTKDHQSSIDIQQVRKNIRDIIPFLKNASFSGGEPFLIAEYFDIWKDFIELNPSCRISVNTNGTILNNQVKFFLQNLPFNISVSIDGIKPETLESIRWHASKEVIFNHLHFFRNYCLQKGTSFNVKTCAIKQNIDEIFELIQYFDSLNITVILNEVVYPLNTALWNNKSEVLKTLIKRLNDKRINQLNLSNRKVFVGLLSLLKTYYDKAIKFEHYINNKNLTIEKVKYEAMKRLNDFFETGHDLQKFMSIIEEYSSDRKTLMILYLFFIIAPFERMIGELEVRNKEELKNIFDTVINHFMWCEYI